jgi:hypothetical protein
MGTPFRTIPKKKVRKCTSDIQVGGRENFKIRALVTGVHPRKKNSRNRRITTQAAPLVHQCNEQISSRNAKEREGDMMRILQDNGYNEQRMQKVEL